jgi:cysteine desulfurase / selenocysteine lyase
MADPRLDARPGASSAEPAADLDALPALIKRDFPALQQPLSPGGAPLVYLDSAATTQKPECVIEAVSRYYREGVGNVHRGAHALGGRASEAHERARGAVARLLHARSAEEIVLVAGCTAAINLVAHAFGDAQVGPGDEVIATRLEHHSNLLPWQRLCERRGATLRVVPLTERGELDLAQLAAWLSPRTRLVAVAHVSNTVGGVQPVREIVALARGVGARVLVDGAQAVARQPVDVRELGCDFYAFSGHKLYAPAGIGALYAKSELLERMQPFLTGGGMVDQVGMTSSTYAEAPRRFEAGTPNVEGAVGLTCAIEYLEALGLGRVMRHDEALTRYARDALARAPGVRVLGEPVRPLGVVTFVLGDIHAHDASSILDEAGVAVRAGHHCAWLALEHFGVTATLRASFGVYNTRADVDALVEALGRVREVFGR